MLVLPEFWDILRCKKSSAVSVYLDVKQIQEHAKNNHGSPSLHNETEEEIDDPNDLPIHLDLTKAKTFLMALPHCIPLNMGFRLDSKATHTYCPLQSNLKGWRDHFQLDSTVCDKRT